MFIIKVAYKYGNEIKTGDSISMNFCPRIGDIIEIDGVYKEVISVFYSSSSSTEVTLFVNIIGDIESHNRWIKKKMKDTRTAKPFNPEIRVGY